MELPRFVKTDLSGRFFKAGEDLCIDVDLKGSDSHLYIFPIYPGQKVETHTHKDGIHFIIVRTGKVHYTVGEVTMTAEPGDLITIPPGMPHSFEALDGESASVIAMDTPISAVGKSS